MRISSSFSRKTHQSLQRDEEASRGTHQKRTPHGEGTDCLHPVLFTSVPGYQAPHRHSINTGRMRENGVYKIKSVTEVKNNFLFKHPNIKITEVISYAIYVYKLLKLKERFNLPIKPSKASLLNVTAIFLFKDQEILRRVLSHLSLLCPSESRRYFLVGIWSLKAQKINLCMKHNYLRNFLKFHISSFLFIYPTLESHKSRTYLKQGLKHLLWKYYFLKNDKN